MDAVSKSSRNRQRAREKVAQMRALEARRRRRRTWLAGIGVAVVVAGAAAGITAAVSGSGGPSAAAAGGTPKLKLAALSTLGTLRPAPPAGPAGPEGVPVPAAAQLAGTATSAAGKDVDGISCQSSEQTIFHIHAHLTIFVNGSPRKVPAGIGIPGAEAQNTAQGPFISSGTCFYWLHTHAADGIVHIESPVHRTFTLGDFFDEWGQPLGPRRAGPATGPVTAIYNGKHYQGNPRDIPLNAHAQIQLEVGTPLVAPQVITFPSSL
jgi:hypothetical protein